MISDEDIDYPKATDPDYLLALTNDAYRTYGAKMTKGLIITDTSVTLDPAIKARTVALPILASAAEKVGKKVVANIVALGVLAGLSGVAPRETLRKAVKARVPKGTDELNLQALDVGLHLAAQTGAPGSTVR